MQLPNNQELILVNKCRDLTLDRFMDCLIHKQYDRLILHGTATEEQTKEAWSQIWDEYLQSVDLPGYKFANNLSREIAVLYVKLQAVEWNVKALEIMYSEENVEALHKIGMPYKYDPSDIVQYNQDLLDTVKRSQVWVIEYKEKVKAYQEYQQSKEGKELTESIFMDNLVSLAPIAGYRLDIKQVTVLEYCSIINKAMRQNG